MYVYITSEPGLRTVGHYAPDGRFEPESDHANEESAAARVHYLNGGNNTDMVLKGMPHETFDALVAVLQVVTNVLKPFSPPQ